MKNYYNRECTAIAICLLIAAIMTGCGLALTVTEPSKEPNTSVQTNSEQTAAAGRDASLSDGAKNPEDQTNDASDSNESKDSTEVSDSGKIPSYYGTWSIKDYQYSDNPLLSGKECKEALSYTVTFSANGVVLNGERLDIGKPEYKSSPYSYDTLTEVYKANLGEWWNGIKTLDGAQEVEGVRIHSEKSFFGDNFFVAGEDVIWINYRGVFFYARKN